VELISAPSARLSAVELSRSSNDLLGGVNFIGGFYMSTEVDACPCCGIAEVITNCNCADCDDDMVKVCAKCHTILKACDCGLCEEGAELLYD